MFSRSNIKAAASVSFFLLVWGVGLQINAGASTQAQMDAATAKDFSALIPTLKKQVVNLEINRSKYFGTGSAGRFFGTGFIVDAQRGLLVTNRHVVAGDPAEIRITFFNGASTMGRVFYYDAIHDFSIVSFEPKSVATELKAVTLGDAGRSRIGDKVLLIGNNEGEEYSVKYGEIVARIKNKGDRHSQTFQTSFDRTGGSSGAPVWNLSGKVIGIHFKGSTTSSFELPISYVREKLNLIVAGKPVQKGELGLQLDYMKLADAKKYLKFPQAASRKLLAGNPALKYVVSVKRLNRRYAAFRQLRSGDIIFSVDGRIIADQMVLFDRLVDAKVGKNVRLKIYRRGALRDITLKVSNAEETKIRQFIVFAGGTIHDITPNLGFYWDINLEGVYLSQGERGSNFAQIGIFSKRQHDRKSVVITAIDGQKIRNLADFRTVAEKLKHGQHLTVTYKDYAYGIPLELRFMTLNLAMSPTLSFHYDQAMQKWIRQTGL